MKSKVSYKINKLPGAWDGERERQREKKAIK